MNDWILIRLVLNHLSYGFLVVEYFFEGIKSERPSKTSLKNCLTLFLLAEIMGPNSYEYTSKAT